MQTLSMSATQRDHLSARNALAINSKGEEILHGLSFEESQFMIDCADKDADRMTQQEQDRYADLVLRHERICLKNASADDEVFKDERRLG